MVMYLLKSSDEKFNSLWELLKEKHRATKIPLNALVFEALELYLQGENKGMPERIEALEKRVDSFEGKEPEKPSKTIKKEKRSIMSKVEKNPFKEVEKKAMDFEGMIDKIGIYRAENKTTIELLCAGAGVEFLKKQSLKKYTHKSIEKIFNYLFRATL